MDKEAVHSFEFERMNILVKTYSNKVYCRPDTSWERENKDFYIPEGINSLSYSPILFVRISKAGKCVQEKFASRYYDSFGYGILLYLGHCEEDLATTSCADHTSILPHPLYNPIVLDFNDKEFSIFLNDNLLYKTQEGSKEIIEKAIEQATKLTSIRIGDFLVIEMAPPAKLSLEGEANIKASFNEDEIINFKLI